MKRIEISENRLNAVFEIDNDNRISLLHLSPGIYDERTAAEHTDASDPSLGFSGFTDTCDQLGRRLEIAQTDEGTGVQIVSCIHFYNGVQAIRISASAVNNGTAAQPLGYIEELICRSVIGGLKRTAGTKEHIESGCFMLMEDSGLSMLSEHGSEELAPGDSMTTAPFAVAFSADSLDEAEAELERYHSITDRKKPLR